ncbi:DMT family transporter [Aquibaculum arenosum]|uniref:DMT family transporter n=1 Tax=Aquibaculum arenosum TaxID=3032591 RepID=A0ABT5YPS2_9PROT|nr:DMT family transporter [Fodinicurvata sp. CAU 1616]MDF2096973.1 DMT family transporter [Fodinicurvata sp. CAU 1616]
MVGESESRPSGATLALVPLLGLLWGFNWPAVRIALDEIAPWTLRAAGMLCAGAFLVVLALLTGRSLRVSRCQWPQLIVTGLLSIAAFNILLAFAQLVAPTSRIVIVTFTMPIWAALLAAVVLGEALDRRRLLGLGLGLAGLTALGWPLIVGGGLSLGLLYALIAGVGWGAGTVLLKRFPVSAPAMTVAAWQLLLGGLCGTVGMLIFEGVPRPAPLQSATLFAFGYHVILAQALAYFIWFGVLPRLPAGAASMGTLMVPAVGVLGSMIFLGERPGLGDWLGLALVLAAAATILLPPRAVAAPQARRG